jgi:hypothetical protein
MELVRQAEWPLIGEVGGVLRPLGVAVPVAEDGAVRDVSVVDDEPAQRDPPLAVTLLQAVEVPAAGNVDRPAILVAVHEHDVALGVRHVAVDLARVARDVVHVAAEGVVAHVIGPLHELLPAADPGAVVVDRVRVEDAAQELVVVAVQAARVAVDAVVDLLPVDQVLQLREQLFGHTRSCLVSVD